MIAAGLLIACRAPAQTANDPFRSRIRTDNPIVVGAREFATIPDVGGEPARMMLLVAEPDSRSLFVNDMRGPLYRVSADGQTVTEYLDINDARWGRAVQSRGRETGFQSFAVHPQFHQRGAPGFGKLYTWSDVVDTSPPADFEPPGGQDSHDIVLLEWTARTPGAATYDGGAPRQLLRIEQPFGNHNGGLIAFNPLARPGDAEFGLLYVGNADGGAGGDPMNLAQNPASPFGKILRLDPLGANSRNGQYGISADNPLVTGGPRGALGEIYALGVRNPQRFGWDPANGRLYVADIGQNTVEEVSPVTKGANLGWNVWEGSFRYSGGGVEPGARRGDPSMTYPIAEYDHRDPILQGQVAVTGLIVYRGSAVPALRDLIVFGDNPSGEIFAVSADGPPDGGQDAVRRVMLNTGGANRTLLQLIQAKNVEQGRPPASRADLRFGAGPDGQVYLLNKQDGVVRMVVPAGERTPR
jgi:hypothetical protein